MIKITIIIILIFLLLITLYSYYCLSSRMINFERERLEHILQKETAVKTKENEIKVVSDCSNKNELLLEALMGINKILGEANINGNLNICNNSKYNPKDAKNDDVVKSVENENKINLDIVADPDNKLSSYGTNINQEQDINTTDGENILEEQIYVEMLSEVPEEYTNVE